MYGGYYTLFGIYDFYIRDPRTYSIIKVIRDKDEILRYSVGEIEKLPQDKQGYRQIILDN